MFTKKIESAGYSGGTFLTLCCGFPARKKNGRRSSDELGPPKEFTDENGEKDEIENEKEENGDVVKIDNYVTYDEISDNGESNKSETKPTDSGSCDATEILGNGSVNLDKSADQVVICDGNAETESVKSKSKSVENAESESVKSKSKSDGNAETESVKSKSKSDKDMCDGVSSEHGSDKSKSKKDSNGAAYQYDEETSSDSDDEVMKHYKENLVRSASMRSAKSTRSARHKKPQLEEGHTSRGSLNRLTDPVIAAEQGEINSRTSYNAESDDDRHVSPQSPHNTATTATEHLFDVSDLQNEPPLISKCGSLEVSFRYDNANSRMVVVIHGARDIPSKDRGGANSTQVRVMLLPGKKQRHKSKVKMGDSPVFGEKIYFNKILPDEVPNMGLRFRLYGLERMRRERMIGESIVGFASLNLDQESTHWIVLEPRSNLTQGDSGFDVSSLSRSDSASSTQSLQHGGMPELLLGLSYNGTTGRLSVEAIKGSNFRNMAMNRAPDTYVKLSLMNSVGQEVQHCKTSVRRGQPNPLFKETFMLQVALFQLPEVTLMVSVYNKKSMKKKEMIGWFSLGMNSSGEEEAAHWLDMRESKGEQVCRWHVLLES